MSLTTGTTYLELFDDVLATNLDDPGGVRWTYDILEVYLQDAFLEMAEHGCFVRRDLIVPGAGAYLFSLFAEPIEVKKVWYDNERIRPFTLEDAQGMFGADWEDDTSASGPTHYLALTHAKKIRVHPAPSAAGTALTFGGSPSITEEQGGTILGNQFWSANSAGTIVHFIPGDGEVTNPFAADNLLVEYTYYPSRLATTDTLPQRYTKALKHYLTFRAFRDSTDKQEVDASQQEYQLWQVELAKLVARVSEYKESEAARLLTPWDEAT